MSWGWNSKADLVAMSKRFLPGGMKTLSSKMTSQTAGEEQDVKGRSETKHSSL